MEIVLFYHLILKFFYGGSSNIFVKSKQTNLPVNQVTLCYLQTEMNPSLNYAGNDANLPSQYHHELDIEREFICLIHNFYKFQ